MRLARWRPLIPLLCSLLLALSCQNAPKRDCFARVWIPASAAEPLVLGSWNGWSEPPEVALPHDANFRLLRLSLPPGEHQYLVRQGGQWVVDPANALTGFRGSDEKEVSLLVVPDCSHAALAIREVVSNGDAVTVRGQFLASAAGDALDPDSLQALASDGRRLSLRTVDPATGQFELAAQGLSRGKLTLSVSARDTEGVAAEAVRVSTMVEARAETREDGLLYQVMLDRFRGPAGAPLAEPPTPGARAGGTLGGLLAEIEAGYFDQLGVTGLWLSPVYTNPDEARAGQDGRMYEGYHGYWPLESRAVDPRLGGEIALDQVVGAAHARGMTVLLDLVPNHVYERNPRYLEHQGDGSFNPAGCVCGTQSCPWNEHIQTCWFTDYLPDVRWQRALAQSDASDEARFWLERFDVDGFRIDAVPMMPRSATRHLARTLRTSTQPAQATFLLGEVFTGPGIGGLEQLGYHLGPPGLDSVFDFPLMWALRGALADGSGSFDEVEATLAAGEARFRGAGATMAHMLGNHDVQRFLSVAEGDAFGDPWQTPASQPVGSESYRRLALAHALVLTLPGLPVIYYGDELGLPGGGDPDSRRVLPDPNLLSAPQQELLATVRRLGQLRSCSRALRGAVRRPLVVSPRVYVYERASADGEARALVMMHASTGPASAEVSGAGLPAGSWVDALSGESFEVDAAGVIPLAPLSARILLEAGDPCANP